MLRTVIIVFIMVATSLQQTVDLLATIPDMKATMSTPVGNVDIRLSKIYIPYIDFAGATLKFARALDVPAVINVRAHVTCD